MTDMVKNELIKTKIPWTPYAPIGWDIKRAKFIFKSKKEINSQMQCNDRLALTLKGVIDRFEGDNIGLNPNDLRTYQIFQPNELVFKLLDLDNKKTSRVGFVHKKGIMSSAYIRVLENPNMNMRYFYYQYFDLYQRFIFNDIGQGVRATMSSSDLLNIPILIPPLETQNAIVNYLDRKTQQIQEFIQKKERLIELLEEKKDKQITNAISKGVLQNIEFKDTGEVWLNEIPKHWEFKALKHYVRLNVASITERTNPNYLLKYIDIGNVTFSGLLNEPEEMIFAIAPSRARRIVNSGDTILSTVRTYLKAIAFFEKAEENLIASTGFAVLSPKRQIIPKYLKYLLSSSYFLHKVNFWAIGVNYPSINNDRLMAIKVAIPPTLKEQKEIIEFIEMGLEKYNKTISKAQLEIEKAKEYQESLITQVVSGQLKVPEKTYSNVHYREFDMVAEQGSSYHT